MTKKVISKKTKTGFDIITVGDIKLDTFVVLDNTKKNFQLKMPEMKLCISYGEKIPVKVVDSQVAGSAPNVAVGLSRQNYKTGIYSVMGEDGTREAAMRVLKKEKVSDKYVEVIKGEQSSYSVVLNYKGEKTILESHIKHEYHLPKNIRTAWMYVSELGGGYEKLYRQIVAYKKRCPGIQIASNPGAVQINERKQELYKLIENLDILFVNVGEARAISRAKANDDIRHVISKTYALGPKVVVMTDGRNGAYAFDGQDFLFLPMFPGKRVEATGAGDAFATGFLGSFMRGLGINESLKWGAVNSASVVGFVGPQKGLLTHTEIRSRLKSKPKFNARKI